MHSNNRSDSEARRMIPLLEIVCLILFCSAPYPARDVSVLTAYIMFLGLLFGRLPLCALIAWYGVVVVATGMLRGNRGLQYMSSVVYCLLLGASAFMIWGPFIFDSTVDWSGVVHDPWIMGTIVPLTTALICCIAIRVFRMIALSRSEWQFTLRDGLVFVAATAVFLGIFTPLIDWSL